jgi:filamentous hemagglutinin family protein
MKNIFENLKKFGVAAVIFSIGRASDIFANPTGMTVGAGSATAQQLGSQLNITVGQTAMLNWQSFNIGAGETTSFLQPSANSVVFNVISGANPSQVFGNLNANGTVILANANGFYFGPNSMIKVGGSFIATTAPLAPDFGSGGMWLFTGMPPLASIVNYGQIAVGKGRSLYLIAEQIENHGSLNAPGGDVELAAGQSVLVSDSPDGRGLSASVLLPQGSVDNFGRITADAGTIALQAKVVNQDGLIQADSVAEQNGVIELVAADQLNLGANSQILARGDNSVGGSAGGNVTLKSGNDFSDAAGSQIATTGGANGGNGGNIEVSAPNMESLNSAMDASAQSGFVGGQFLLDPASIVLGTTGSGAVGSGGTVGYNSSDTLNLNVNTAFKNKNFSSIDLQATGNITISTGTTWDLSGSIGLTAGQLMLQAGGDIIFGNKSKITDANDWSVSLYAGYNFNSGTVQSGTGNIYLNGGSGLTAQGTIQLAAGDINLFAGQNIFVAPLNSQVVSGSIFTTGGGNIFADALAGNIVAGTSNGGSTSTGQTSDYNFTGSGAKPNPFLGGISTGAGGNVTLIAGGNIDSTPIVPSKQAPGASGTYGAGNVTVIAGNQITGNYTLANGIGTMLAGVQVSAAQASALQNQNANPSAYQSALSSSTTAVESSKNAGGNIGAAPSAGNPSTSPVTLSLISGAWNAYAANDISIKEVNNPNGAYNTLQSFLYNYAPNAAANFWAGNAIELIGANLNRLSSVNKTPIYAPILSLNAGAGGILIDKSIILAPSSEGALSLITRPGTGGNLSGAVVANSTVLNGITMSDSGSSDYATFASGHATVPLHLNDPNPVQVSIDGSINSFSLVVPTFAQINVAGSTYNFGFQGRNLSAGATTSINVQGSITYRGDLTAINLTTAELADLLPTALFTDSSDTAVTGKLSYNAATGQLSYVGVMSASDLAFLLAPSLLKLDQNGNPVTQPVLDSNGNPVLDANGNPETVSVTTPLTLNATQQAMIQQLYTASQTASLGGQGLLLAGPGNFNVQANTIDLGVSGGISVLAPDAPLTAISPDGATLNVTTVGDLTMTSTKISNESYLGGINLSVGGALNVGGQFTTLGDPSAPKGIFTMSSGNISVTANNDVNLNGSRIAAYNGGNVTVESFNGNVNAGSGGAGYVTLDALQLDSVTGLLTSLPATIPGSGILATTVAGSQATLGNILIEAPNGNISASQGGVIQISFNSTDDSKATTELLAGYELHDANGGRVPAQNLDSGTAVFISDNQNIDASGSGVIAQGIILKATGKVGGLYVSRGPSPPVFDTGHGFLQGPDGGTGPVIFSSGGKPIISGGPDSSGPEPTVVSDAGSNAAPPPEVTKTDAPTADTASTVVTKTENQDDAAGGGGDENSKKKKGIALAAKVSRVTVLLPGKN